MAINPDQSIYSHKLKFSIPAGKGATFLRTVSHELSSDFQGRKVETNGRGKNWTVRGEYGTIDQDKAATVEIKRANGYGERVAELTLIYNTSGSMSTSIARDRAAPIEQKIIDNMPDGINLIKPQPVIRSSIRDARGFIPTRVDY